MPKEQFLLLYNQWREETRLLSICLTDNAAFEEIVEAGEAVVPYIKQVLEEDPSWIVLALPRILKTQPPVPLGYEGRLEVQIRAWISYLG